MTKEEIQTAIDMAFDSKYGNGRDGVALRLEAARLQVLVNMHEERLLTPPLSPVRSDSGDLSVNEYVEDARDDAIGRLVRKPFYFRPDYAGQIADVIIDVLVQAGVRVVTLDG